MMRPMRRLMAAAAAMLLFASVPASAYGEPAPYFVKVSGPNRVVDCGSQVTLTTTVLNIATGTPIAEQFVNWKVEGSSGDRLSSRRSTTDKKGRTSVTLSIAHTAGDRRVTATAAGIPGHRRVRVTCAVVVKHYASCTALTAVYPHGVGLPRAVDHTSGTPVTTFFRHRRLYLANSDKDRDGDGIACESR